MTAVWLALESQTFLNPSHSMYRAVAARSSRLGPLIHPLCISCSLSLLPGPRPQLPGSLFGCCSCQSERTETRVLPNEGAARERRPVIRKKENRPEAADYDRSNPRNQRRIDFLRSTAVEPVIRSSWAEFQSTPPAGARGDALQLAAYLRAYRVSIHSCDPRKRRPARSSRT